MSIDNLFTKQQWRELELITLLSETKNPLYYKDACQLLDCSVLTLQSCVTNSVFMEDLGKLFYKDSQFHIHYNHQSGLKEVYRRALLESPSLQLMSALFFDDFASLDDLAEALFISLSTLKRLIRKTNLYLKEHFDIIISAKPIRVVGDEYNIRLFYIKYFSEAYTFSEWPFASLLNENHHEQFVQLMASLTEVKIDFAIFRHLKLLSAVNLIRYLKGFKIGKHKALSSLSLELLQDSQEMKKLSHLFVLKFSVPLDELVLSEMFSNYLDDDLVLGKSLQVDKVKEEVPGPQSLLSWIDLLSEMEGATGIVLPNKYEVARYLHATVILGVEDINESFLIYDYKKDYLAFFKEHYTYVYFRFTDYVKRLFKDGDMVLATNLLNNLVYSLLIAWENFFLTMCELMKKPKLLIIERSHGSTGSFLEKYIGEFFEITIFDKLTIEALCLQHDYDVIITDTVIRGCEHADIFFFSRFVPTVIVAKLNHYLRKRMGSIFETKTTNKLGNIGY